MLKVGGGLAAGIPLFNLNGGSRQFPFLFNKFQQFHRSDRIGARRFL
jgi:hypothetical protein